MVDASFTQKIIEANKTNGIVPETAEYARKHAALQPSMAEQLGAPVRDKYWVDDLYILFRPDRVSEFFPSHQHTNNEQLNALTRFFIYLGLLLAFHRKSCKPLFFASVIPIMLLTYYRFNVLTEDDDNMSEEFMTERPTPPNKVLLPTAENPFMNPDPTMYGTADFLLPPADVSDPVVQREVEDAFNVGLLNDDFDVNNASQSFMHFNTVPRMIDYGAYADYLYKLPEKSCKEDPSQCRPPYRLGDVY